MVAVFVVCVREKGGAGRAQGIPHEAAGFIKTRMSFISFAEGDIIYRCGLDEGVAEQARKVLVVRRRGDGNRAIEFELKQFKANCKRFYRFSSSVSSTSLRCWLYGKKGDGNGAREGREEGRKGRDRRRLEGEFRRESMLEAGKGPRRGHAVSIYWNMAKMENRFTQL